MMKKIIHKINPTKLFIEFFESEKSGGLVLIACTILSLALANSKFGTGYHSLYDGSTIVVESSKFYFLNHQF